MNKLDDAQRLIDQFRGNDPRAHLEMSPRGWTMSRGELVAALQARIAVNPTDHSPNQGQTSRCGPAAFLYCLLANRPDLYVKFAIELWRDGRSNLRNGANGRDFWVEPGTGTIGNLLKARQAISGLDWLTMGSLSKPHRGNADPGDEASAITFPRMVSEWFVAAGSIPHVFKFDSVFGDGWFGDIDVFDLRDALALYGADWIVLEVNPDIIADQSDNVFQRHWVVVSEQTLPTFGNRTLQAFVHLQKRDDLKRARVDMQFACWGSRHIHLKPNITVSRFLEDWYGAAAFPPIR